MPGLSLQLENIQLEQTNASLEDVKPTLDVSIKEPSLELSLEPKKNKFIEETFEEYKARKFSEHEHRLMFLFSKCSQEFENCEIKKIANSRNIKVYKEGRELMELFNQEAFYYINDKTADFLQKYIPSKINEHYTPLPNE
jgi:hypothetical protein